MSSRLPTLGREQQETGCADSSATCISPVTRGTTCSRVSMSVQRSCTHELIHRSGLRVGCAQRGGIIMPKLERSQWYDLSRDMNWPFKYVTEAEVFPAALSHIS